MRQSAFAVLLMVVGVMAQGRHTARPFNTLMWDDTLIIDSTESEWTSIYWQDNGATKVLLVQAYDDSAAGFADDSACVGIDAYQVFNVGNKVAVRIRSTGADSSISDSLQLASMMDTTVSYLRNVSYKVRLGGDTVWTYNDEWDTLSTDTCAFWYSTLAPDASPGISFKLTGKASNKIDGDGSKWILRVYQLIGSPMVTN